MRGSLTTGGAAVVEETWPDDVAAVDRRAPSAVTPLGWPRDTLDCYQCGRGHARHICCGGAGDGDEALEDCERHSGELELITWNFVPSHDRSDDDDEGCASSDDGASDDVVDEHPFRPSPQGQQQQQQQQCGHYYGELFARNDRAFRWTCCGMFGDARFGCDHHGTRGPSCTCDSCVGDNRIAFIPLPTAANRLLAGLFPDDPAGGRAFVPWSPEAHRLFLPALRAKVRTLLLCLLRAHIPVPIHFHIVKRFVDLETNTPVGNGAGVDGTREHQQIIMSVVSS